MSTETTSRYANDPRVTSFYQGDDAREGYTVVNDEGREFHVLHTDVFSWVICEGPNLDFVPVQGGGFAIGITSADGAIEALIGDPRD